MLVGGGERDWGKPVSHAQPDGTDGPRPVVGKVKETDIPTRDPI